MIREEFYNLYDKISDALYNFEDYHCSYYCSDEIYNGHSLTFDVHGHSDQGEGHDWVEYWVIDDCGRIHAEGDIYENYEEFLKEWI